jgi:hypothetical protein
LPTTHPVSTLLALILLATGTAPPAGAADLDFLEQSLELPGAPAALVSTDLDGDGVRDLAVVVVYTDWDQIGIEEMTEMDQVEGLVEVLTIVPVLLDRREIRAWLGKPGGGYEPAGEAIPLPLSVLTLEAGPPGAPAVALTDDGASALVFEAGALRFVPLIESPPVIAGSGAFLAGLDLVNDLTGDGIPDLLLPTAAGLAVHRGTGSGLEPEAVSVVPLPEDGPELGSRVVDYPLPRLVDLDGDGRPDLVFRTPGSGAGHRFAARNLGGGRFAAPTVLDPREEGSRRPGGEPVFVGRLAPDGPATAVYLEEHEDEDAGMREELAQAREPDGGLHFHPLRAAAGDRLEIGPDRDRSPQAVKGYVPEDWAGREDGDDEDFVLPGGFQDLDGDGRTDLVTVTNDITLLKAMAVLATRRLTLNLGFHPWCQEPDGSFTRAPGLRRTPRRSIRATSGLIVPTRMSAATSTSRIGHSRVDSQIAPIARISLRSVRAETS